MLSDALPHVNGRQNLGIGGLLPSGWRAIRGGKRERHTRLMVAAALTGVVFVGTCGLQTALQGHQRFPGDGWVRSPFPVVLWTLPVWAHVAASGLVVYVMNNGVRPA
jgi:uncharacterized membrane protein YozB (DUF420 family)